MCVFLIFAKEVMSVTTRSNPTRLLTALCVGAFILGCQSCSGPRLKEPGGTAEDAKLALTNPDEYAWHLFFFLNHQAKSGIAGRPDETKMFGQLDPEAPVVWETWGLASGGDQSEVFRPDGSRPVAWEHMDRTHRRLILDKNLEREMIDSILEASETLKLQKVQAERRGKAGVRNNEQRIFPPEGNTQEARMNRSTFDSIVDKFRMYNADGLEDLWNKANQNGDRSLISLPAFSKEVKAEWMPIEESDKPRYLWRTDEKKQVWGLVSLHIITKDLPNWFWADFGHIDCEGGVGACASIKPPIDPPVDHTTRGPNGTGPGAGPEGRSGVRREAVGTVWANYILRGTQTDFIKSTGRPTTLFNPLLEGSTIRSSCISCHALAAVGQPKSGEIPKDHRLQPDPPFQMPTGAPKPVQFGDEESCTASSCVRYLQTDFMWVPIIEAKRKK
jgi:hypothetical protein